MSNFNLRYIICEKLAENLTIIVRNPDTNTHIMFLPSSFIIGRFTLNFNLTNEAKHDLLSIN